MKQGKLRFLSFRVMCVFLGLALIKLVLLCVLAVQMLNGEGEYLGVILFSLVLAVLLLWFSAVFIVRPYTQMEKSINLFLDGYTTSNLMGDNEGVFVSPAFEGMVSKIQYMMQSQELLNLNKRQAQYLALQNQINPHFLYNTLESIRSEALIAGLMDVADMTEALATFFRYTISKVENLVSIEEEIQNCMTYFKIQQYRFGERLQMTIECEEEEKREIYQCRIPKLTLQPILENSIIHGTECKLGTGHIRIKLERTSDCILLWISDDGSGMDESKVAEINERLQKSAGMISTNESESQGGIALVNVNNRIHLLYGEEYGLHVYSMPEVGTDVEIRLPAVYSDRDYRQYEKRIKKETAK